MSSISIIIKTGLDRSCTLFITRVKEYWVYVRMSTKVSKYLIRMDAFKLELINFFNLSQKKVITKNRSR